MVRADFPEPDQWTERMGEGDRDAHHHHRRRQLCMYGILWTWRVMRNISGEVKRIHDRGKRVATRMQITGQHCAPDGYIREVMVLIDSTGESMYIDPEIWPSC